MKAFQWIFPVLGLVVAGMLGMIIFLPMLISNSVTPDTDSIAEIDDDLLIDDASLPVRRSDESMLPYATIRFSPDGLALGNEPTAGKTYGWTLPDGYIQSGARTILLGYADHAGYAVDLSVFNQPQDVVPVYSPIIGTVIETTTGSKPGYGEFTRIRNAQWACVNNMTMWQHNDPATACGGTSPCLTAVAQCKPCVDDVKLCVKKYATEEGVSLGTACENDPPAGAAMENTETVMRVPDCVNNRCCVDSLGPKNFDDWDTVQLGYGKISNYEVVISHMTEGSLAQYSCQNGSVVDNTMQCGTMGTSGENNRGQGNSLEPMVHYEVWRSQCSLLGTPDTSFEKKNPEDYLGKTSGDKPAGIPAPCCPPLSLPGMPMLPNRSENSCGMIGIHGDNAAGIVQLVNHADTTLWADYGLQITCNGAIIWDLPIVKIGLDPGEVMTWEQGQQPPVFYEGGNVGSCPLGSQMGLNITQVNSGDIPTNCQGAYLIPGEVDPSITIDDAMAEWIAKRDAAIAQRKRLCAALTGLDKGEKVLRERVMNNGIPYVGGEIGENSCVTFTSESDGNDSIDLLPYFNPEDGPRVSMSNGETKWVEELPASGNPGNKEGFRINKNDYNEDFFYDDEYLYHGEDTTWATGPGEDVTCVGTGNHAKFSLFDNIPSDFNDNWGYSDYQNYYNQNKDAEGGKWVPRSMQVGDSYSSSTMLLSFDKGTGEFCMPAGQRIGTRGHTMELVRQGSAQFCSLPGQTFDDVIQLTVTSGAGTGESFFYAKGYGWMGFERRNGDPINGPIYDQSTAVSIQ